MKGGLKETPSKEEWLVKSLPAGSKVGVDSKLISFQAAEKMKEALSKKGDLQLELCQGNLVYHVAMPGCFYRIIG